MTVREGIDRDIEILNSIKTPAGIPMKVFMETIGLPIYNVISDLESMNRFFEEAQRRAEEKQAAENAEAAENPDEAVDGCDVEEEGIPEGEEPEE